MSALAPVVLFVYNRPSHTIKTLLALAQNDLAKDSLLYIFADGPKETANENELKQILETRKCIREKKWCKEVIIIEKAKNQGLAHSIINGVTDIVNRHGKVIVLEDDIITSRGFLKYMNNALDVYDDVENVWHISGYWYPVKRSYKLPKIFFFNAATCWGWATWKRAWLNLLTDPKEIKDRVLERESGFYHFNMEGGYPFSKQLQQNIDGVINTWAVKWYGSIFLNNAFALHPNHSLTNNIGFDATGTNCEESSMFIWPTLASFVEVKRIPLTESVMSRRLVKHFFNPGLQSRNNIFKGRMLIKKLISRLIGKLNITNRLGYMKLKNDTFGYLKNAVRFRECEVTLLGKKFLVADGMSFYYSYKEIFEKEIYKFDAGTDAPVIIDCGCNYGTSIVYFKTIYPNAEIIGFEPDPKIFSYVRTNVTLFGFENVSLYNKGLWREEKSQSFISEGADGGRLFFNDEESVEAPIQIETVLLSKFLQRKVDFLKIDIEGAELEVLLECENYLSNVTNLFVEYHSFSALEQRLDVLLSILTKCGFRYDIERIGKANRPFIKRSSDVMDLQLNIFAFRKEA